MKAAGISRPCAFNQLPYFHIMENYSADIMHDLLEGWLPREIGIILQALRKPCKLTLKLINQRINAFPYGSLESNWPVAITYDSLVKKRNLNQSAAQMFTLFRLLPFLIGDKVPSGNPVWQLYLSLCDICDIVFSTEINEEQVLWCTIRMFFDF